MIRRGAKRKMVVRSEVLTRLVEWPEGRNCWSVSWNWVPKLRSTVG